MSRAGRGAAASPRAGPSSGGQATPRDRIRRALLSPAGAAAATHVLGPPARSAFRLCQDPRLGRRAGTTEVRAEPLDAQRLPGPLPCSANGSQFRVRFQNPDSETRSKAAPVRDPPPGLPRASAPSRHLARTSRVMVFPVRVFTKICILAATPPEGEEKEEKGYTWGHKRGRPGGRRPGSGREAHTHRRWRIGKEGRRAGPHVSRGRRRRRPHLLGDHTKCLTAITAAV